MIEYTTYLVRISLTKTYPRMLAGVAYKLAGGMAVRRSCGGHFDVGDSLHRFFISAGQRAHATPG